MRITTKNAFWIWLGIRLWVILCGFEKFPYPQAEFLFSDVRLYDWWAGNILDGHFPINDPMWQYPPLAAMIFALGYAIAHQTVGFVILALLADLAFMYVLVTKCNENSEFSAVRIWLITPLVMGPIFLGRFDVFPTLIACLAVMNFAKPLKAGALLSLGALLKVWPVFGLLAVPKRHLTKTFAAFIATTIVCLGLIHMWWSDNLNFLQGQKSRGLQIESVGALPYMWWNAARGTTNTNFQYGAIEVIAQGTSIVSALITLLFICFLAFVVYRRLIGALERVVPAHIMMLIVLMSMLTSRVLSPQYNLWVLGLLAVVALDPLPHFNRITQLIMVSAFCGQLLYPWLYVDFQQGGVVPTAIHTIRICALISATVLVWMGTMRPDRAHQVSH